MPEWVRLAIWAHGPVWGFHCFPPKLPSAPVAIPVLAVASDPAAIPEEVCLRLAMNADQASHQAALHALCPADVPARGIFGVLLWRHRCSWLVTKLMVALR